MAKTTSQGGGIFPGSGIKSEIIAYVPGKTITKATVLATYTGTVNVALSPDDGTTWEYVTIGTEHTFTASGEKLKFAMFGTTSSTLSNLKIIYKTS